MIINILKFYLEIKSNIIIMNSIILSFHVEFSFVVIVLQQGLMEKFDVRGGSLMSDGQKKFF